MACTLASLSRTVLNAKGTALRARRAIVPRNTVLWFAFLKSLAFGVIIVSAVCEDLRFCSG